MLRTGIVCTKRGRNNKDYTRVIRMSDVSPSFLSLHFALLGVLKGAHHPVVGGGRFPAVVT